jgi:hypothetical protein
MIGELWKKYTALPRNARLALGISLGIGGLVGPYIMPFLDLGSQGSQKPLFALPPQKSGTSQPVSSPQPASEQPHASSVQQKRV